MATAMISSGPFEPSTYKFSDGSEGYTSIYPPTNDESDYSKEINRYQSFSAMTDTERDSMETMKLATSGCYYDANTKRISCYNCDFAVNAESARDSDILSKHSETKCKMTGNPFQFPETNRSFTSQSKIENIVLEMGRSGLSPQLFGNLKRYFDLPELDGDTDIAKPNTDVAKVAKSQPESGESENKPTDGLGKEEKTSYGESKPSINLKITEDPENEESNGVNGTKPRDRPPSTVDTTNSTGHLGAEERINLFSSHSETMDEEDEDEQWYEEAAESNFASERIRLASFRRWPQDIKVKPVDLASAGFYYTGLFDNVKCFYCGGGIRNFGPTDTAWEDHARWLPKCKFLLGKKGEAFVAEVQEKWKKEEEEKKKKAPAVANAGTIVESTSLQQQEARVMNTPQARGYIVALEEMGYLPEVVKTVLLEEYRRIGKVYDTVSDVIDALSKKEREGVTVSRPQPTTPTSASGSTQSASGSTQQSKKKRKRNKKKKKNAEKQDAASVDAGDDDEDDDEEDQTEEPQSEEPTAQQSSTSGGASGTSGGTQITERGGGSSSTTDIQQALESLNQERQAILESRSCIICLDAERDTVMLPCAHLIACASCAARVDNCPFCRKRIKGTVKVFM